MLISINRFLFILHNIIYIIYVIYSKNYCYTHSHYLKKEKEIYVVILLEYLTHRYHSYQYYNVSYVLAIIHKVILLLGIIFSIFFAIKFDWENCTCNY